MFAKDVSDKIMKYWIFFFKAKFFFLQVFFFFKIKFLFSLSPLIGQVIKCHAIVFGWNDYLLISWCSKVWPSKAKILHFFFPFYLCLSCLITFFFFLFLPPPKKQTKTFIFSGRNRLWCHSGSKICSCFHVWYRSKFVRESEKTWTHCLPVCSGNGSQW